MQSVSLVFPHQIFKQAACLQKDRPVFLIEEDLFFTLYRFHCQKLMMQRAAMRFYADWLKGHSYQVHYVESGSDESDIRKLLPSIARKGVRELHFSDPCDDWLMKRISKGCMQHGITFKCYPSPGFLNSAEALSPYLDGRTKYFQTEFYIWQRKQRKLLLSNGKPLGGQWSYDAENRKKLPKGLSLPGLSLLRENAYQKEARIYIASKFKDNPGDTAYSGMWVCDFESANRCLQDFVQNRLTFFGPYEDAISKNESVLFHSLLSPLINIGLLTPAEVLDAVLQEAAKREIPLPSLEGFIRQLIGWRELIRGIYIQSGIKQRNSNYWQFNRPVPASFYTGTTGIEPVDNTIKKILRSGYCHHIERLMILGNFMLLCEFDPHDVYRWFMEMFIDAWDWVMVPNVYGMSQFADGGMMATKPYISGSNYILKMSDYKAGTGPTSWNSIWDALFWRFMDKQRSFFMSNPRMGMLIRTFDKMPASKREEHLRIANDFLGRLDAEQSL
ncbi:MAG TPA: cryptochrome/photolyase family protein [Chitinophagaceae bacterium]|nr:cryptochrome/photolyase family protein [Chitinophagaceae bacterium]